jgi:hypothetical protein
MVQHVMPIRFPRTLPSSAPESPKTVWSACAITLPLHANTTSASRWTPPWHSPTMDSPPSEISPDNGSSGGGRSKGHHKKRVRVWTEDDRAKHRVFEKGRREAFSDSLLVRGRTIIAIAYTDVISRLLHASYLIWPPSKRASSQNTPL